MRKFFHILYCSVVLLLAMFGLMWGGASASWNGVQTNHQALPSTISGIVSDANGPMAGVTVQVKGIDNKTTTAANGAYTLKGITWDGAVTITAYKAMYMVGYIILDPSAKDWKGMPAQVNITMKPVPIRDNFKYGWFSFEGVTGSDSCALCHRENAEWEKDAHSQSAVNPRFLSIYRGTNLDGQVGQRTTYGAGEALPPDLSKPYYGEGYKLDEPNRDGNCATCHTPMAAKISNTKNCGWSGCHTTLTSERATTATMDPGVSPLHLSGDAAEGINCDFCHKIGAVVLDPHTNLPKADMPGILSMKLYRPEEGQQVFFGTFGDVSRRVSYNPLLSESEYCAPCHYGVFGGIVGSGDVKDGVVIYNSYGEWLDSPYSDPETGQTCQDCHMPVIDSKVSVFAEKGGIERDYVELHSHYMPGASDLDLMQNAVTMTTKTSRITGKLQVEVTVTNDKTGHHVPTDAPMREMILVVEVKDASGKIVTLLQGPKLTERAGNYSGQPGKIFAKLLRDEWTGESPTAAYWRPVTIVEDTRLAAMASDTTHYSFNLPASQTAKVSVRLVYRRANQQLMDLKGWTDPDIIMEEEIIQVKK